MKIKIVPTEPRCGDCTLCCEIVGFTGDWKITDIYNEAEQFGVEYGPWKTCNRLCETGCSIEENKPRVCKEFFCQYIEQNLSDKHHPKKTGFITFRDGLPLDSRIVIHSKDKTSSPDIQYENNKTILNDMLNELQDKLKQPYLHAILRTEKGTKRIR